MDYVKISEESLDEIMRKIRIENGMEKKDNIISTRNENIFTSETNDENYEMIDKYLNEAVIGKQIGLNIAPMKAKKGLALKASRVIERIYLRVSQLITRDIRDFNSIIITLGHTIKRKLNIIDSNVKYLQDTVNKLNEEVGILKSMVCQLKDDNRSKFYSFEQILKENKEKLKEYEIKFNNLAEEKIDNSIKEIDDKLSSTIKEIYEKKLNDEKSIDDKIALVVDKYNQEQILIRKLNEDIVKLKSIVKWSNKEQFNETVNNKIGTETLINPVFYHEFEEKFRGTRNDIKERLTVYIPIIDNIFVDWSNKKCVDLGCGRGEWLDILKDKGVINYIGVDLNEIQLNICSENGHETVTGDCIDYIKKLPAESVDMISGIQLIEHLPIEALFVLFNECNRVLKKGGIVLFETPNPNNLITGATYFYADPTHKHPLYKETMRFFVENSGFEKVEIIDVNPERYSKTLLKPTCFDGNQTVWDQNIDILNNLLYGPQDYAVLGVK